MIKDIVVNLSVSARASHAAEAYAVSLAGAFGAHLRGVAFIYDPTTWLVYPMTSYGETPAEVTEALKREKAEMANDAAARFTKATSLAGLSSDTMTLRTSFLGSVGRFGEIARRHDLAVVGQPQPGTEAYESNIVEGALFVSGRPVILVPHGHAAAFTLDRVMVCWDGGVAAARALADAMPLLARAEHIEVVTVAGERGKPAAADDDDLARHLARHGLAAEIRRITREHADVAGTLLSHAADSGTDLIVMGGHGHSRMREFFLGSVTDAVLRSLAVPALMSH
jgi:nucleotide-binding universal stress UspA family protein